MPSAQIIIGLAYGDEGKGSWVDHLVRKHNIRQVVRFNGGVQANHNVVTPEGHTHGFAQFGAGTFVPGVDTLLSRFMLVEPEAMMLEAQKLERASVHAPLERMYISTRCPVITPFNRVINRILEIYRGGSKHGSCGMGIGLTQQDVEQLGDQAFYVGDMLAPDCGFAKFAQLAKLKLAFAKQFETADTHDLIQSLEKLDLKWYVDLYDHFTARVNVIPDDVLLHRIATEDTVFEGAQGVLLDQQYGFFPHVTRSNCTFQNAEQLLHEAGFTGTTTRIGLLRGYATRHGAGPFVTEDQTINVPPCHNHFNQWQGQFRTGWFDAVAARYALEVVGNLDILAITNLDRMRNLPQIKVATSYRNVDSRYFVDERRLRVIKEDITTLADRCDVLNGVEPEYAVLPGLGGGKKGVEEYVTFLERELRHEVGAVSEAVDCCKWYR